ncbi:hypothetical protein [Streptomyces benahoarensis]|uniref:Uncharacterized protein n=1 Tax=Streptomyces benahoarensis TaxID=2595054 RepID=A0A553ZP88_9ACTN|nr:hypothetical protein [Streptomyces benahoarensis]TSB28360.1 hypothetical protein FNJ62_09875 [Streptomyces benahoarensis]TSB43279.1 hypothetical protein FNZ23_05455 [Streptomyces benahoarensis]
MHIGTMTGGAIATGAHGKAVHQAAPGNSATDEATRELVAAMTALREHLQLLTPTEETAGVRSEIASITADIAQSGSPSPGRLERLRAYLEVGTTAVSGLASALPVVQAIGRMLG